MSANPTVRVSSLMMSKVQTEPSSSPFTSAGPIRDWKTESTLNSPLTTSDRFRSALDTFLNTMCSLLMTTTQQTSSWDGVRNHQAKNLMKNQMRLNDLGLFYHSSCKIPAIVGVCKIVKQAYPDHTAFDSKSPYFDPKSSRDNPTWYMVDVEYMSHLKHEIPLLFLQLLSRQSNSNSLPKSLQTYIKDQHLKSIANSHLLSRGRLSVQPVDDEFFKLIELLNQHDDWIEWFQEQTKSTKKLKTTSKNLKTSQDERSDDEIDQKVENNETTKRNKRTKPNDNDDKLERDKSKQHSMTNVKTRSTRSNNNKKQKS
ncbi:hypothetical protein OIO90_006214 [Microbotryomycetes sp. JL221]|nr:hypothetical protein OIO90_006214 [Microbotryomycetes sp. JL221]